MRQPFVGACIKGTENERVKRASKLDCVSGKKVRIRITNSGAGIPLRYWIAEHEMTIVARDVSFISISH